MQSEIIKRLIEYVTTECKVVDQEERYNDMLDECYSFEDVGGPFENMLPSRVLKEVDSIAYQCGMNDYFGTDDSLVEVDGEYYEQREVEKARDEFVDDLEDPMFDLESEIEDMENDEDASQQELAAKKRRLEELRAEIEEVRKYVF